MTYGTVSIVKSVINRYLYVRTHTNTQTESAQKWWHIISQKYSLPPSPRRKVFNYISAQRRRTQTTWMGRKSRPQFALNAYRARNSIFFFFIFFVYLNHQNKIESTWIFRRENRRAHTTNCLLQLKEEREIKCPRGKHVNIPNRTVCLRIRSPRYCWHILSTVRYLFAVCTSFLILQFWMHHRSPR